MNQNKKAQKKLLPRTSVNKSVELKYKKTLDNLVFSLNRNIQDEIVPILKMYELEYTADANYASLLTSAFKSIRRAYSNVVAQAEIIANGFVTSLVGKHKDKFQLGIENALDKTMGEIINNENLSEFMIGAVRQNTSLITSISDQYLTNIESIVWTGVNQGASVETMTTDIVKQTGITYKRARVIASDQSHKITANLNQIRQERLGIVEYRWITSGDEKVRHNHATKNKKIFKWDSPPEDTGHPGQDYNCRCIAQPVMNL